MIEIITGLPGAGKSYYALHRIVEALVADPLQHIYTNIAGLALDKLDAYIRLHGRPQGLEDRVHLLTPEETATPWNIPHGALIFMDEAHLPFSAKDYRIADPKLPEYVTEHRHFGHTVVLITQDPSCLDKSWRLRCEMTNVVVALRQIKVLGFRIWGGRHVMVVNEFPGLATKRQHASDRARLVMDMELAACYNSWGGTKSGTQGAGTDGQQKQSFGKWMLAHPLIVGSAIVCIVAMIWFGNRGYDKLFKGNVSDLIANVPGAVKTPAPVPGLAADPAAIPAGLVVSGSVPGEVLIPLRRRYLVQMMAVEISNTSSEVIGFDPTFRIAAVLDNGRPSASSLVEITGRATSRVMSGRVRSEALSEIEEGVTRDVILGGVQRVVQRVVSPEGYVSDTGGVDVRWGTSWTSTIKDGRLSGSYVDNDVVSWETGGYPRLNEMSTSWDFGVRDPRWTGEHWQLAGSLRVVRDTQITVGTPIIKDIPLLGLLFQWKSKEARLSSVAIFVRVGEIVQPLGNKP